MENVDWRKDGPKFPTEKPVDLENLLEIDNTP